MSFRFNHAITIDRWDSFFIIDLSQQEKLSRLSIELHSCIINSHTNDEKTFSIKSNPESSASTFLSFVSRELQFEVNNKVTFVREKCYWKVFLRVFLSWGINSSRQNYGNAWRKKVYQKLLTERDFRRNVSIYFQRIQWRRFICNFEQKFIISD